MEAIAKWIWKTAVVREGILLIIAAAAVTLAQQGADLANTLEVTEDPIGSVKIWLNGLWVAISVTVLKQASVYILQKLLRGGVT